MAASCGADPAPDQPEGTSALTEANSNPGKWDILMDPLKKLGF